MKQGDIVIINFPFTNFAESKIRPAVIISNETFNSGKNVILSAISTKQGSEIYSTTLKNSDLNTGQLNKDSYIKFSNILSIEKHLILKKVAELNEVKRNSIYKKINLFLKIK